MAAKTLRAFAGYMNSGVSRPSGHHLANLMGSFVDAFQDLLFALKSVVDVGLYMGFGFDDRRSVGWPIDVIVSFKQFKTLHVVRHVAVRRRNDAGGPAHNMVAGKQCLLFL